MYVLILMRMNIFEQSEYKASFILAYTKRPHETKTSLITDVTITGTAHPSSRENSDSIHVINQRH